MFQTTNQYVYIYIHILHVWCMASGHGFHIGLPYNDIDLYYRMKLCVSVQIKLVDILSMTSWFFTKSGTDTHLLR